MAKLGIGVAESVKLYCVTRPLKRAECISFHSFDFLRSSRGKVGAVAIPAEGRGADLGARRVVLGAGGWKSLWQLRFWAVSALASSPE